ncbi:MAG: hypothetical protein EOL97_13785 [Spirochaetia bacterium]|nr:hypothetical protein [Spirochaetia bacterium]
MTEHICKGKIKGIYINYVGEYDKEYVDAMIKPLRKINNISIGINQQSIHHVNFIFDNKSVTKISIGFRPMGVKPEDIDGPMLSLKKEKEGLNVYEQLLYGIWQYHFKQGRTKENKLIDSIIKELHNLKNKWTNDNIDYNSTSQEYKDNLKKEANDIIVKLIKYEIG